MLTAVQTAYTQALSKQSYSVNEGSGSRSVSFQSIDTLRKELRHWTKVVNALSSGRDPNIKLAVFPGGSAHNRGKGQFHHINERFDATRTDEH